MIDYKEQIKSPLWQKKRLEILSRDKFSCVVCGSTDKQLHIHHKRYISGLNYWDYPDELLMTLCDDCHRKVHKVSVPKFVARQKSTKKIFYKALLKSDDLTYNEMILYSFLVSKSISILDAVWIPGESKLDDYTIEDNLSKSPYIPLYRMSYKRLSEELNMSFQSAINGMNKLIDFEYIKDETIFVDKDMLSSGYFELDATSLGLKGEALIFYSYLKEKAGKYGGCIDTYKVKIAKELNVSKVVIKKLLNRLYKINLAKRLPDNKLQIL